MRTSDTITKIAPALIKAQKQITFAAKDAKNPHYNSKYANLESVIEAVKLPLNDNGIFFTQTFSPSEVGYLNLTTRLIHESGEYIEDTMNIPLQKNDAQGYGSAATYARRYALSSITGLFQADDDGQEAVKPNAMMIAAQGYAKDILHYYDADDLEQAYNIFADLDDSDMRIAVWNVLQPNSKLRSALKKLADEKKTKE